MFLALNWGLTLLWHFDGSFSLIRDSGSGGQTKATSNKSHQLLVDALGQMSCLADDVTETAVEGTVYDGAQKRAQMLTEYGTQTYQPRNG